jgi:hypothetical protein
MIANEAHFKIFDMKGNTPLLEEGEWTVVQLLKENDAYRFGEAMFNERGRSLKVKNGEFQFDFHIPIDEDEETVYLLYKKNGEKGKKLQDGYFVLRVLPDNPSMILRQNYEYAYKIYKETEGDKEAKLDGISNGGIDFEGLSTDAFTSEEQRMKSYGLFSNFGGTLTADYEDIPQIYRTSISSDLTYYPKGVYPSSKADASPPTIEMLEASKSDDMSLVQRYDFSSMIEKKNLEQISQPNAPKFGYQVDSQGTEINYWIPLYDDTSKVNQKDYLQTDSVRKGLPIQWIIGGVLLVLVIGFGVYLILTNRKGGEKNEK